ncbi:MAG: DNA mismatch repair endonuclease MutL [Nitrospirae bacterium]|nr:DNA mismatch repair endonuclease MutL [Candidatus Troglogloeales bacterium]
MSKIIVLSEGLANKIAAGEVVERPASVVKELVENAIDAKSNWIVITLMEGGIKLVEVQDNGEGMTREDALLSFARHATSKLAKEEDLFALSTLGFRGEALPSIASVSKIGLVTRSVGSIEGSEIVLTGGTIEKERGIGAPIGSTFSVSDLFYNTPARRKFLKSPATELGHISQIVFQLALAHPEINFQLIHQGKKLLSVPTVSTQKDRLLQLYGGDVVNACLEAGGSFDLDGKMTLHAFFSKAPVLKNHRKDQLFFVNRRPVKSPLLSHAIYEAYRSFLMKGEHPFCSLYLSIDPSCVDVNVHPTKKEVRFQNTDEVYKSVKNLIREQLEGAPPASRSLQAGIKDFLPLQSRTPSASVTQPMHSAPLWTGWPIESLTTPSVVAPAAMAAIPLIRAIGQVYETFLLAEIDGEFVLIDQHTAHERMLYESFLKKKRLDIQPLLIPRQVDLPLPRASFIMEALPFLQEVGLKIEPYGETTFLVREIPAELTKMDLESFLADLSEDLAELGPGFGLIHDKESPRLKIIAGMACHAAVRANQSLTLDEVDALLHDYFSRNTPPTCPHGRPVIIKYPLLELEKQFRRK